MGLDCHVLWVFGRLPMGRFLSQNQQYHSFSTCAQLGVWTGRGEERRGSVFGGAFSSPPRYPVSLPVFLPLRQAQSVFSGGQRSPQLLPRTPPRAEPSAEVLAWSTLIPPSPCVSLSLSPSTFQPSHCLTGSRAAPHLPWRLPCVSGACAPAPRPFLSNAEASA